MNYCFISSNYNVKGSRLIILVLEFLHVCYVLLTKSSLTKQFVYCLVFSDAPRSQISMPPAVFSVRFLDVFQFLRS